MLLQPFAHLDAKAVAGLAQVVFGQHGSVAIEQVRREFATRLRAAAESQQIQMHAPKVARCLVLLGVADRAERMVRLQRHLAQRGAAERRRSGAEVAPVWRAFVEGLRRVLQRQAHAFERDQAVRELVLHGLKLADRLAELAPLFRVIDCQLERAPCRAMGAREQAQAQPVAQVDNVLGREFDALRRCVVQAHFGPAVAGGHAQRARRQHLHAALPAVDEGERRAVEREQMRGVNRAVDEAERAVRDATVKLQRACRCVGCEPGARDRDAPQPLVQRRQPFACLRRVHSAAPEQQVRQHRAEQRHRAGSAAELLHHDRDLAQATFFGVAAQGGEALPDETTPQRSHRAGIVATLHRAGGGPMRGEEAAHRIAKHRALLDTWCELSGGHANAVRVGIARGSRQWAGPSSRAREKQLCVGGTW